MQAPQPTNGTLLSPQGQQLPMPNGMSPHNQGYAMNGTPLSQPPSMPGQPMSAQSIPPQNQTPPGMNPPQVSYPQ
jgi:hypothetical protein